MAFDGNIVEEVKNRCNIVDIVGQYVELKKTGSNYKGCCPFHHEKTPSFVVSETKQIFTCFGCGETGDVFKFLQKQNNLSFIETLELLAKQYGIEYKKKSASIDKQIYYDVNKKVARYFFQNFWKDNNIGREYMLKRGIKAETLRKFGVGYADGEWTSLYDFLEKENVPKNIMKELGLVSESNGKIFDKFRNRVIFPIFDTRGRVIGFGGRSIGDDMPKYLNSQESYIFLKKNNLYGLNFSKEDVEKEDYIILVEGYMDVISLYQSGINNVVASLGTALTENQVKLIKRYTRNIVLSYDSDEAGIKAALRGIDIVEEQECKGKVLTISEGKDPDEFIKKNGRSEFLELVKNAETTVDYKINLKKQAFNTESFEGMIDFLNEVVKILRTLKPIEANMYANKIAKDMGVSASTIINAIEEKRAEYLPNNNYNNTAINKNERLNKENRTFDQDKILPIYKTLIKLVMSGKCYYDKALENKEYIKDKFTLDFLNWIKDHVNKDSWIDFNDIKDIFNSEIIIILKRIDDEIYLGSNMDEIWEDCLKKIIKNSLLDKKEMLLLQLSMADEENNKDEIFKISQELQTIQNLLKDRS